MKRYVLLAVCLWPALAYGQQTYTNADLVKLDVPGAYTNEDLKKLSPLALQGTPAARTPLVEPRPVSGEEYQAVYDGLRRTRAALVAERDDEIGRVDFSESARSSLASDTGPRRPPSSGSWGGGSSSSIGKSTRSSTRRAGRARPSTRGEGDDHLGRLGPSLLKGKRHGRWHRPWRLSFPRRLPGSRFQFGRRLAILSTASMSDSIWNGLLRNPAPIDPR